MDLRCGYEQANRKQDPPMYCIDKKCPSSYWNKPQVKNQAPK